MIQHGLRLFPRRWGPCPERVPAQMASLGIPDLFSCLWAFRVSGGQAGEHRSGPRREWALQWLDRSGGAKRVALSEGTISVLEESKWVVSADPMNWDPQFLLGPPALPISLLNIYSESAFPSVSPLSCPLPGRPISLRVGEALFMFSWFVFATPASFDLPGEDLLSGGLRTSSSFLEPSSTSGALIRK